MLYELSTAIYSETDINILLDMVVDSLLDLFSAEKALLEISNQKNSPIFTIGKDKERKTLEEFDDKIKALIMENVYSTGNSICMANILDSESGDEKDELSDSTRSVLCVPLKSKEQVLGAIYLENADTDSIFSSEDANLLISLAERIAQAVENNLLLSELKHSQEKLLEDLREKFEFDEIIGNSSQMVEILKTVADVADTDATVLIEGESGTGKELLARATHFNSGRSKKPFVTINCAAIPETLLESELFGYEKGAFTGATQKKPGKFEIANGGTIFLDEIGEMSSLLQVKILRFLQSHEFEALGSNKVKRSDIRIIAATNKDLFSRVKEEEFREDLYYRINVINLKLPPLRERRLDIAPLAESFARDFSEKLGKKIEGIDNEVLNLLSRYHFPGNIRELENIIERAVILAKNPLITRDDLPKNILNNSGDDSGIEIPENYQELKTLRKKVVEEVEKKFIKNILEKNKNNISRAAKEANMHRVELQRLLKKHR
ncbi:MAG: hypothetical protein AMJ90_00940 [candidate division Zixibacteria bacterium SM23_73_2]|nr:MAG: hypothetical protein AMJ90_00940 [candidate division Zixibacteria bacterium SM23_73_2]